MPGLSGGAVLRAAALAGAMLAAPAGPAAAQGRGGDPSTDFEAYRALFSTASLGRPVGRGVAAEWTLAYRGMMPHTAFAFAYNEAGSGVWYYSAPQRDAETARSLVQAGCDRRAAALGPGVACRVVAVDGRLEGVPDAVPLVPRTERIGPFRAAPLMFRHGPEAARGVIVWGHGYGGPNRDLRAARVPGFVAILNDAGWDVLRFDREPAEDDLFRTLPRLTRGLPLLREAGYRRIVLGGQSRGGWQAMLAAAERPELVDAVIAAAPGAHGTAERPNNHVAALEDFRRVVAGLPEDRVRLAVLLFEGDAYDPDPMGRAAVMAELAARRDAPTLALWPREEPRGHDGVLHWRFTLSQGGCLLTLVQAPAAAVARGVRREPCGGG